MFVVTGANSNTGRAVAMSLLERGAPVRVIGRSTERLRPFADRGAEAIVAEPFDRIALEKAFAGAKAVYAMLQPGVIPESDDFSAYQREVIEAIASALVKARTSHVVALSGWGANYDKVGVPLEGLAILENRLESIGTLNTLALRPGWFMENATALIHEIAASGSASGQLRGDLALPMIATADIGAVAADALITADFRGFSARELEGPEPLSLTEAARLAGEIAGKPDSVYRQISPEDALARLLSSGFSTTMADAIVRMTDDVNAGRIRMMQPREARIITTTRFQSFASAVLNTERTEENHGR
ncbi:NAD(P)H-binding protein [Cupriavidus cauae]|nr:NAD(P)H-binding protein [Cupriavidus cauae]